MRPSPSFFSGDLPFLLSHVTFPVVHMPQSFSSTPSISVRIWLPHGHTDSASIRFFWVISLISLPTKPICAPVSLSEN